MIVPYLQNIPPMAECAGGFADVHRGKYNGRPAAVKVMRLYTTSNYELFFSVGASFHTAKKKTPDPIIQRFCREAVEWRHLRHPNVLPLLGATLDKQEPKFALVSEWMDNGNINQFIQNHGEVNRVQLVSYYVHFHRDWYDRFPKLVDVGHGLEYLHRLNVVHGDLKGVR